MDCEKCGKETRGFRKRGPGHPTIPYCRVCYYPKRFAYCACGGVKSTGAKSCRVCRTIYQLEARIGKLLAKIDALKKRRDENEEIKKEDPSSAGQAHGLGSPQAELPVDDGLFGQRQKGEPGVPPSPDGDPRRLEGPEEALGKPQLDGDIEMNKRLSNEISRRAEEVLDKMTPLTPMDRVILELMREVKKQ